MTMHETLNFIDALHGFIERNVSNPGPWCWPTRTLAAHNLRLNRAVFPRDKDQHVLTSSFEKQVDIARKRGWMSDGPCAPHCHGRHLSVTAQGREALRLMNEQGCGPQCQQHRETKLHLERRIAA